jgi:hypothetical protein
MSYATQQKAMIMTITTFKQPRYCFPFKTQLKKGEHSYSFRGVIDITIDILLLLVRKLGQ